MTKERTVTPDRVALLAERCIAHVKERFGMDIGFDSETLGVVDVLLDEIVREEAGGISPPPGDVRRSNVAHLFAPTVGAYFGQVVRGVFPSRWRLGDDDPASWWLEFERFFFRFNPVGVAAEAMLRGSLDGWDGALVAAPHQTEGLRTRLAAAPPLPEDQFWALTSRYEAIQIADDWLRQRAAVDDGPAHCSAEDYDLLFGIGPYR